LGGVGVQREEFARFAKNCLFPSHWKGLKPIERKAILSCFYEGKPFFGMVGWPGLETGTNAVPFCYLLFGSERLAEDHEEGRKHCSCRGVFFMRIIFHFILTFFALFPLSCGIVVPVTPSCASGGKVRGPCGLHAPACTDAASALAARPRTGGGNTQRNMAFLQNKPILDFQHNRSSSSWRIAYDLK
jgi:hypothetical protein